MPKATEAERRGYDVKLRPCQSDCSFPPTAAHRDPDHQPPCCPAASSSRTQPTAACSSPGHQPSPTGLLCSSLSLENLPLRTLSFVYTWSHLLKPLGMSSQEPHCMCAHSRVPDLSPTFATCLLCPQANYCPCMSLSLLIYQMDSKIPPGAVKEWKKEMGAMLIHPCSLQN